MRFAVAAVLLVGCVESEPSAPPLPKPLDVAFATSLRPGDAIVLIPGTGSRDYLGATIDAMPGDVPEVDVRTNQKIHDDAVVLEQAIATAERAGFTHEQIERGDLTLLMWGAGFQRVTAFEYTSFEHLRVRVDVLGGQNAVAVGMIVDHYIDYSQQNVDTDAHDVYRRLSDWLDAHPAPSRNVVVVSHSYGGAVGEYLALEMDKIAADLGPLPAGAQMPFTIAAGVPPFVLGYNFLGPRVLDLHRAGGTAALAYEIDRPDDPVHNLSFQGNFHGHYYNIVFGDEFEGCYGITTDEMSCGTEPGECPAN